MMSKSILTVEESFLRIETDKPIFSSLFDHFPRSYLPCTEVSHEWRMPCDAGLASDDG